MVVFFRLIKLLLFLGSQFQLTFLFFSSISLFLSVPVGVFGVYSLFWFYKKGI